MFCKKMTSRTCNDLLHGVPFSIQGSSSGRLPNEAMPGHHASGQAGLCDCVLKQMCHQQKNVQESGTLHLHYLVPRQPSRDTGVTVKGPTGCVPPPVISGKLENPVLNLNRASVLLLSFVLCWLALVEVLRSRSFCAAPVLSLNAFAIYCLW